MAEWKSEYDQMGFMELSYRRFMEVSAEITYPPNPPVDLVGQLAKAIRDWKENPSITRGEAVKHLREGKPLPEMPNEFLEAILDTWRDLDNNVGKLYSPEIGSNTMEQRLLEEDNPRLRTDRELTLARIHDAFARLDIGARVAIFMYTSLTEDVLENRKPLEEVNELIANEEDLLQFAKVFEKVYELQRRVTLLDRYGKPNFLPPKVSKVRRACMCGKYYLGQFVRKYIPRQATHG